MFVAEKLIFLELQKTGGSHIRRLLEQYTDGSVQRKHDRVPGSLPDKYVFGSIRNPWDWYVSLWAYGAGGKGAIRIRTSRRAEFRYYNYFLPWSMGKRWLTPSQYLQAVYHDLGKPVETWQATYRDSGDAGLFRDWLRLLLDPARRFDIGEGFGFSPLSGHAGLLSYRYLRQFTAGSGLYRDNRLARLDGMREYDAEHNLCSGMVRTENLEEDFVEVLSAAGYALDDERRAAILNKENGRTNYSERKPVAYYYDDETIELVANRDRFVIEKYAYRPPLLQAGAA